MFTVQLYQPSVALCNAVGPLWQPPELVPLLGAECEVQHNGSEVGTSHKLASVEYSFCVE